MQLAVAMWTTGVVPSQYRVVGPGAWPGARDAILGAKDRIVFANSGGKHLSDLAPKGYVRIVRKQLYWVCPWAGTDIVVRAS